MKKIQDFIILIGVVLISSCLILFSEDARKGVSEALELCKNVLVPAMFPFLILSNFVACSDLSRVIGNIFSKPTVKLFNLPSCCTSVVICSMLFGYPTGAVMTSQLLNKGDIDEKTATRMLRFAINGGLPFIVTAVGGVMYCNKRIGWILFFSLTISAILIGIIEGQLSPKMRYDLSDFSSSSSYNECFVDSVKAGAMTLINVCAFVLLFGAIDGMLSKLPVDATYLLPFLEITEGASKAITTYPVYLMAFFFGFGGICIHMQFLTFVREAKMRYLDFLVHRVAHGVLSVLVCNILLYIFPVTKETFSNMTTVQTHFVSVSTTATVILILMCLILIVDIENKKKIC